MIILVRKVGEAITIGDTVIVKVLGVRSGQIKLGIKAPRELSVHREEIYERIKLERDEESQSTGPEERSGVRFARGY